jgi:PEP-CTERM motif
MRIGFVTILVGCLCVSAASQGQGTFTISFDGPPVLAPGTATLATNYSESGMSFTPIHPNNWDEAFARRAGSPSSGWPDNGTAYLQALGAPASTLMFRFTDGSLFNLISVDLAGYSTAVPDLDIQFIGYHPDGSTVTTEFTGSGINFQSYYFKGLGFDDLTRVEVPVITTDWSLDNLVVSVPEPGSVGILVLGALIFVIRTRRRIT